MEALAAIRGLRDSFNEEAFEEALLLVGEVQEVYPLMNANVR